MNKKIINYLSKTERVNWVMWVESANESGLTGIRFELWQKWEINNVQSLLLQQKNNKRKVFWGMQCASILSKNKESDYFTFECIV